MSPKDADRMANSVDPDQTAPVGAVWSGSILFAKAYLSENLGSIHAVSCEIRQIFKGDLIKFCEIFTKITLELSDKACNPVTMTEKIVFP